MQTDSYAQGVPYPLLTDKPNAQTLGQGIVEGLVPRSVMRFASRSERGAVVQDPEAGMVTYILDEGLAEMFDGTRWVTMAAGTSLWTKIPLVPGYGDTDPSAVTGNNNQGEVQYRVVNLFGERALMLRGGTHVGYQANGDPWNAGEFMAQLLPPEARPANLRTVPAACSATNSTKHTVKLDIEPSGTMRLVGISDVKDSPPWVSFNGIICSL